MILTLTRREARRALIDAVRAKHSALGVQAHLSHEIEVIEGEDLDEVAVEVTLVTE